MWINLRTTDLHRKYDLADLTYHETIPGHVWEGEYSNRLPLVRSVLAFNAFSEGWALYAEQALRAWGHEALPALRRAARRARPDRRPAYVALIDELERIEM